MSIDEWISVKQIKPPKAKPILLYNGHWIGVGYYKKNYKLKIVDEPKWSDEHTEYITPEPTHWQPLPKPPQIIDNQPKDFTENSIANIDNEQPK